MTLVWGGSDAAPEGRVVLSHLRSAQYLPATAGTPARLLLRLAPQFLTEARLCGGSPQLEMRPPTAATVSALEAFASWASAVVESARLV